MTPMVMRFPYPRRCVSRAEAPPRWRLRGTAVAAALILGAGSGSLSTPIGYADRGVAQAPATTQVTADAPVAAVPVRTRTFTYDRSTGTLREA